jgi:hypothetical protein
VSFDDDVNDEPYQEENVTETAAAPPPETSLDAGLPPDSSWLVVFQPDGAPSRIQLPPPGPPPEAHAAFAEQMRDALASMPGMPGTSIAMPRPGGGYLNLLLPEHWRPSPTHLAALRSFALSKWLACIHAYGEVRWESEFRVFDTDAPCVTRTTPAVGPPLAASCPGVPISYQTRPDGLRCGSHPDDQRNPYCDPHVAGFIESAWATDHGVYASLLVLREDVHKDLMALDAAGQLEAARLCLSHSATAIPTATGWGLKTFTITSATANSLSFSSLAHTPGTHCLRRLEMSESPSSDDLRPTARLHVPSSFAPTAAPVVGEIEPGAVTTERRQNVNSATHAPTWPSGIGTIKSVEYSVSVAIGENYIGVWFADLPSIVSHSSSVVYGMVPVVQNTSNAKAWASTTQDIGFPTAVAGTFYYW